jgi:hypothetical protein
MGANIKQEAASPSPPVGFGREADEGRGEGSPRANVEFYFNY